MRVLLYDSEVRVPGWVVDLESFRRWTDDDAFPEFGRFSYLNGEVWEDLSNNWVRTRRIWNQHTYHVTNVTEDGQIPRHEAPNWLDPGLNNFRQNVQTDGLFDAPR